MWGPGADLAFRRGWTHGVLALAVWPFALTGVMCLAHRSLQRWRPRADLPVAVPRQLLLLSAISILSHPILDTLNTYGVRWLMPFSGRWFYGDALFIVDPLLWLVLGLSVALSRRHPRPARLGLLFLVLYVGAMATAALAARRIAARDLGRQTGQPVEAIMVAPLPVTPLARSVVAIQGNDYRVGMFRWLGHPRLDPASLRSYPRGRPDHPAVDAAISTAEGRRFLGWARFPTYRVEERPQGDFVVHIVDLRYAHRPGVSFGAVSIRVGPIPRSPRNGSGPPPQTPR